MAYRPWQPGDAITASHLNAGSPQAWQPWTVDWTTSGSSTPGFGNADVRGLYTTFGRLCVGTLFIQFGSTTDFGGASDNWRFSSPVEAADSTYVAGWGELQGDGTRMGSRVRLTTTTTFECEVSSGRVDGAAAARAGLVDATTPWTWASGDLIRIMFHFETAE